MEKVRTLRVSPYIKGQGPTFTIDIFDNGWDRRGAPRVAWSLRQQKDGKTEVIFDGEAEPGKWVCAGWFAVDSDEAAELVMAAASIAPGDTDQEYFEGYSERQLEFVEQHGEFLGYERERRYCDANGNPKRRR